MPATLVLNASYEPLGVVDHRRAVVLVLAGRADLIDAGPQLMHAEKVNVPIPRVVRLTRWVRVPYARRVPLTRVNVLRRDGHRCVYCAGPATTIDHVVPRCRGGQHAWTNVVAACGPGRGSRNCNGRKGDRMLAELGWMLAQAPAEPAAGPAWLAGPVPEPAWVPWLDPAAAVMSAA